MAELGRSTQAPVRELAAAVAVTYEPDERLDALLAAVVLSVATLVVVDNSTTAAGREHAQKAAAAAGAELIVNGRNEGVAAALNRGIDAARERGCTWVLTLDQDSVAIVDIVAAASRAWGACPIRERLAVIGAAFTSELSPATADDPASVRRTWRRERAVITSGSLVAVEPWAALGGFREDLFVDYVDIEYCLRAVDAGYGVISSLEPTMAHASGHRSRNRLVARDVTPTHHSALRRYYITRNRIETWRRFGRTQPRFVARDIVESAKELVKLALFEEDRVAKGQAVFHGSIDGLLGRMGPRGADSGRRRA